MLLVAMPARSEDEVLAAYLANRDVACPVCRYNLRGIERADCPECGARLDLRVGSIDLKLGPWLVCFLAVALPAGFTGILAVIATIGARRSTFWGRRDWIVLGVCWALTLGYTAMLVFLSRRRAEFLRRSPAAQWWRAGVLGAVTFVLLAGTLAMIVRYLV